MANNSLQIDVQPLDIGGSFARGMAPVLMYQELKQKNNLMRREESRQKALDQLAQGGGALNQETATQLFKIDPKLGLETMKMVEGQKKDVLDRRMKGLDYGLKMAPFIKANPQAYAPFAKTMVQDFGSDPSMFPPLTDPQEIGAHIDKLQQVALSYKDQIGLNTPKITNIPVGDRIQPTAIYPGGKTELVGPGGPRFAPPAEKTPQWFENPDNPKEGSWVTPGQPPPSGWIPKSQMAGFGKETEKKEDKQVLAQMLVDNEMSPKTLSKRGDYNTILAGAKKIDPNYNPAKQELKWYGAQRWVSSLSSPQQARMEISGTRVIDTVDELKRLSSAMNLTGFHPLNYAEIESKVKLAGNTEAGQIAAQYITAANDLKELMATAASGGYAPTESAWKLANQQVNTNFGVKQMHAALDELKTLMRINVGAGKQMREQFSGPASTRTSAPSGAPSGGGGGATQVTPEQRQAYQDKLSRVQAMPDSPQKQTLLRQLNQFGVKWGLQ